MKLLNKIYSRIVTKKYKNNGILLQFLVSGIHVYKSDVYYYRDGKGHVLIPTRNDLPDMSYILGFEFRKFGEILLLHSAVAMLDI